MGQKLHRLISVGIVYALVLLAAFICGRIVRANPEFECGTTTPPCELCTCVEVNAWYSATIVPHGLRMVEKGGMSQPVLHNPTASMRANVCGPGTRSNTNVKYDLYKYGKSYFVCTVNNPPQGVMGLTPGDEGNPTGEQHDRFACKE